MNRFYDWRRLFWPCLPVVPIGCTAFEAAFSSFHSLTYPQYFNDACGRFGEFYPATPPSELPFMSAIWLSPALPLLFFWRKRGFVIFSAAVCMLFSLVIYVFVTEDLASNVNCYKRIGTGEAMVGLVFLIQTFLLLAGSLFICVGLFVRRFSWPSPPSKRPAAP